jgi:hypothetical protein
MPLLVTGAISAGASIFSGLSGAAAARAAGTRQANAGEDTINYLNDRTTQAANDIQTGAGTATSWVQPSVDYAGSLQMPYVQGGQTAETQLNSLLAAPVNQFSYDPSQIASDPGYQFTLAQGQKALEQSAAARGQSLSGGQLEALSQFNQGNAATYENQFYNQALNTFNTNQAQTQARVGNLFGQTSQGENAASTVGSQQIGGSEYESTANQNAGNLLAQQQLQAAAQYGNAQTSSANSSAASTLAANSQMTNGVTNATSDLGNAIFLNQLMNPSKPYNPGPDPSTTTSLPLNTGGGTASTTAYLNSLRSDQNL